MSSSDGCFLFCFRYVFTLGFFFPVLNKATSHSFIYSLVYKFTVLRIKPRVLCLLSNPSTPGLHPWPGDICLVSFCKTETPSRLRFNRTCLLSSTRYTRGTSDQPVWWVCLADTNVYFLSILNSFHPSWLSGQGVFGASTVRQLAIDKGCWKCCDCHLYHLLGSLLCASVCY